MPAPSAAALLREIDRLSLPDRNARLARLARDEAGTPALAALLDALAAGDAFARHLALLLATVAGTPDETVARLLADPDPAVAAHAVAAAVRTPALHDLLVAHLPDLPRRLRRGLFRAVRRRQAHALAARLVGPVRARFGDAEAAALLSACPPDVVEALLPEIAYAVTSWAALARRHPDAVLAHLRRTLAGTPVSRRAEVWSGFRGAAEPLVTRHPGALLDLFESLIGDVVLPLGSGAVMGPLARLDRDRVLRLLRDPRRLDGGVAGRVVWRCLGDAPDADLVAAARDLGDLLPRYLRALPPRRRPAVVAGLAAGGALPTRLAFAGVDLLPTDARHAEAARLLGRPEVADDPQLRLAAVARLPWGQARDRLWAATREPDATDRAAGYNRLLTAATLDRDPGVLGEVLGDLGRLRNEQDPVRAAALSVLRRVPSWRLRRVDLAAWVRLCVDAAEARDVSGFSLDAVAAVAGALLREGAVRDDPAMTDAAVTVVDALGQRPTLVLRAATRDLPHGAERTVLDALLPRLESDAAQDRFATALALADALRRRAWDLPVLQSLLDRARRAADDAVVRRAVALWLDAPATRAARVAAVLAVDPSTILLDPVRQVVERRRTDLLDDVVARPPRGRFATGRGHTVPGFRPAAGAWLPRQLAAFAALLEEIARGAGRPAWERAWAIRLRAPLPGGAPVLRTLAERPGAGTPGRATPDTLRRRPTGDDQDAAVVVAEAALAGLGHTDDPAAAVVTLLGHVDGDRARVAVPAVRRCLDGRPPAAVEEPLRRLLGAAKVTTRKDAVRLVVERRGPDAARDLLATVTAAGEHRDVRRAAVAAAGRLLDGGGDAATVWDVLDRGAADPVLASAVLGTHPLALPEHRRGRYGRIVLGLCREPFGAGIPDPAAVDDARRALGALPAWTPWLDDTAGAVLGAHVVALGSTATWRSALVALVRAGDLRADGATLLDLVDPLVARLDRVEPDRDQPARQRLHELAAAVARPLTGRHAGPTTLRPTARALAERLAGTLDRDAVDLAARAVDWTQPDTVPDGLRVVATLTGPHVATAVRGLTDGLLPRLGRLDGAVVRAALTATAAHDATGAAVAVGVVAGAGPAAGWTPPWRALLAELRAHPDRRVRGDARDVVTDPE